MAIGFKRWRLERRIKRLGYVESEDAPYWPDKRELRCGPWDKDKDGITVCRKCGRLDPLDFIDCMPEDEE